MNDLNDLTPFICRNGDELVTDSRAVALVFGKRHQHVMRSIRSMLGSKHPEIAAHYQTNFGLVEFIDAKGERRPMYRMTQKGMAELAMGFGDDVSRLIRIRFLNAFECVANRHASLDRSITQMLMDHDKRASASVARGRVGAQLLARRRHEKSVLDDEARRLRDASQPDLPLDDAPETEGLA